MKKQIQESNARMRFFYNKLKGFTKRYCSYKYGLFYFRNADYKISNNLKINGIRHSLHFDTTGGFESEFDAICLYDCYKLSFLKKKIKNVNSIIDVGANQGIFLVSARQNFPNSDITCYEPNKLLEKSLSHNAAELNAAVYYEAVTKTDCKVMLNYFDSDLATTTVISNEGEVKGVSLQKVLDRAGGKIDILKMDCEGAEWDLLEDITSFKYIRSISMEYHLATIQGMDLSKLYKRLEAINFKISRHTILSANQGIVVALNKSF